jgi:hypothetical protein
MGAEMRPAELRHHTRPVDFDLSPETLNKLYQAINKVREYEESTYGKKGIGTGAPGTTYVQVHLNTLVALLERAGFNEVKNEHV